MVDISVVLPAYNEASIIGRSLHRLARFLDEEKTRWRTWEILVVDDGSDDATHATATDCDASNIRVLRRTPHRGKGAAIRTGLEEAAGKLVVVTDVDLSYGLPDIATAVDALEGRTPVPHRGPLDMVVGDRRHPDSRMELSLAALGHVVRRQLISGAFNLAVRMFFALGWRDTQCGLKGFRSAAAREIAAQIRTDGFLADIEMFLIAGRAGRRIGAIPVHLTYLSSDSTVHVARQAGSVLRDAVAIKRAQMRGEYGSPSGR